MAVHRPPTPMTTTESQQILCPFCYKPNLRRARFCQHCGRDVVLNNDGPRYYITRVLKQGGQGAVYETIGDDNQTYAVKEMLDNFTDAKERQEGIERFEEEANMLQRLAHPRIPRVYAHFKDEGRHYLTMDFVRGEDLEELLEREGAQPEARVLEWADQICDVLHYLHTNGLIYRDMKPSNVMIDKQYGGIKIVDFGIAKVFQPTQRGTQIGTPGYAPPEQYQGLATITSDIYALGATLHHLLTGRDPRDDQPFTFPDVRQIKPFLSERTAKAISKALQMKPEDRFQTVAEFRDALHPPAAQPTQVRRSAQTQAIPSMATSGSQKSTATPAAKQAARPATGIPSAVSPTVPATSLPQPQSAQTQQPAQKRGVGCFGFLMRAVFVVMLLGAIAFGALYLYPDMFGSFLPTPLQPVPSVVVPTPALNLVSQQYTARDLQVVVPANADAATIRQAFILAYTERARQELGDATVVNPNQPPSYLGGEPQQVGTEADGQIRLQASMLGRVSAPPQ